MSIELFIVDACVVIDFITTDSSLLKLTAEHVGTIHVASVVLAEVDQLDTSDAISLGLRAAAGASRAAGASPA